MTVALGSEVQPLTVQVADIEYVPTAEMVKLVPVAAPCDQVMVPAQPLVVKVNVDGEQTTKVAGGVIVGAAGLALISSPVTTVLKSEVQPLTVQLADIAYVPTADSIMVLVPEVPFDQVTVPAHPLAVRVRVDGEQTDKLAGGVIVGAAGLVLI